jgi:phospholipase C
MLRFIEVNWNIRPLARRDAEADPMLSAFDFNAPPREPVLLPATRHAEAVVNDAGKPRKAIFTTYGAAIGTAILLVLVSLPFRRRREELA